MTTERRSPRATARAAVLACPFVITTAVYYFGLAHAAGLGRTEWELAPAVFLGVLLSERHCVVVKSRTLHMSVSLTEMPIALGFAFLPPLAVVLIATLGYLAAMVLARNSFFRTLAAIGCFGLGVTCGIWAYGAVIGGRPPASLEGWLAILVGLTTCEVVNLVAVLASMRLTTAGWRRPPLGAICAQVGAGTAVVTAGAILTISLVWVSVWGVLLVAAVVVAANLGYRATVRSNQRFANLEKLYDFTRRLSNLTDGRDVMLTVLDEARSLLSAGRAEVVIPLSGTMDGTVLRCVLQDDEPPLFEEGVPVPPLGTLMVERGPLLLRAFEDDEALRQALDQHGVREALVAPLKQEDRTAGYLLVGDRPNLREAFSPADLLFFEALAANAGVALRSSELMAQLRLEAAMRHHQAHHDRLTGLPNRVLFNEKLQEALDDAATRGEAAPKVAVMLVDLDSFKDVNDTLGHHTGDAVLREMARRLTPLAGDKRVVARMGGDEFAVLLAGVEDVESVEAAAEELLDLITRPMAVETLMLDIRASLGVAVAPQRGRGRDAVNMVRHADIAMYSAKQGGGGVRMYDPQNDRSTLRRLTLATELRRAIEKEELDVYYQPVVHLGTGEVLGCEALLRWEHREFGSISPVEFIPVAENTGLIDPLTWWVLERALTQVKQWHDLVPRLTVSVNLSARSLTSRRVPDRVTKALSRVGLDASSLTLELTESSMMADPSVSQQAMFDLKDMGIKLSIDDYGTGFSSLSRLKDLPFRELKIDRSFIKEMIHDLGDEAIVRSTIDLARNLGRTVTAEGVEDKATLHRLASFGCTAAQGYYLARPLPARECTTWLSSFVRWPSTVGGHGPADLSAAAEAATAVQSTGPDKASGQPAQRSSS